MPWWFRLADAKRDDREPSPSSPAGKQKGAIRLPTGLRIFGFVSAVTGILGAVGLVYLVATSEELFFGWRVDPAEKTGYYLLAWMVVAVCGAQLFALAIHDIPKIWAATLLRIVTLVIPMFVTPAFEFAVSIGLIPVLHLVVNGAMLAAIRRSVHWQAKSAVR